MEFCPKCGALLIQGKNKNKCPRCNYYKKGKSEIKISEKMEGKKEIAVISEDKSQVFPIVGEDCKKCKNKEAYFWSVQMRSGDEAETKFFKCTKCGFTWREYR